MSLDEKTEELFLRIRKKCQDRGWFGADEWMVPGFSNPPPFRITFPDVATKEQLEQIGQQLGFPLPHLLRDLYLYLANGDICFGYGILSAEQLLEEYRSIYEYTCFDGAWHWPEQLIPLCYWGCTLYSYLDCERGIILFADTEGLFDGQGDFLIEASSLLEWLDRWVTKQDRYPSLAKHEEGDGMDRKRIENVDDEEDPQARAMGLEELEDDPHTPIPLMSERIDTSPDHNALEHSSLLGDKLEWREILSPGPNVSSYSLSFLRSNKMNLGLQERSHAALAPFTWGPLEFAEGSSQTSHSPPFPGMMLFFPLFPASPAEGGGPGAW